MLSILYIRIIKKLKLSREQLIDLKGRLQVGRVCEWGQFVDGDKKCPNTHPVAIVLERENLTKKETKQYLSNAGVTSLELWAFYLLYDIPAILSNKLLESRLLVLHMAIDQMLTEGVVGV